MDAAIVIWLTIMEYLFYKWPRIFSNEIDNFDLFSSIMISLNKKKKNISVEDFEGHPVSKKHVSFLQI